MAEIRCPHCKGAKYELVGNGVCKCSYCGSTFTRLELCTEKAISKEKKQHFLTIHWKGMSLLNDVKVSLSVNGVYYDDAYLKRGFSITVPLEPIMKVTLAYAFTSYTFSLNSDLDSNYEISLNYSITSGWFSSYDSVENHNGAYPTVSKTISTSQGEKYGAQGRTQVIVFEIVRCCLVAIVILFLIFFLYITGSI